MAAPEGTATLCVRLVCTGPLTRRMTGAGLASFADRNEVDRRVLAASVDFEVELEAIAFVEAV